MFDRAVASMFDLTNPAERDRVMKLFPGYFARQRAFVDSKFAVMRKYVDISMTGIQSEEDAKFVYNVKMGLIQLPMGYANFTALTEPMNPETGGAGRGQGYTGGSVVERGPFNIYQYFTAEGVFDRVAGYSGQYKAHPFSEATDGAATYSAGGFWGPVAANVPGTDAPPRWKSEPNGRGTGPNGWGTVRNRQ